MLPVPCCALPAPGAGGAGGAAVDQTTSGAGILRGVPFDGLAQQLNWVDWAVLLVVITAAATGMARGFLLGVLDLLSLAVSTGLALVGSAPVANVIVAVTPVPRPVAALAALLALLLLFQLLYSAAVGVTLRALRQLLVLLTPFGCVNQPLGAIPGAAKGLVVAALVLLPFALFPLVPPVSTAIQRSTLGSRLVSTPIARAADFQTLVAPWAPDSLSFLAPLQTGAEAEPAHTGR